jgi:hypothetical protein
MMGKATTGTTPVKAALLSIATLLAIAMFATGIYSADASADHAVVDGYGVGPSQR